jgi:glutathione S-transferase
MLYLGRPREAREEWRVERGEKALDLMEQHLQSRSFFVGDAVSVADVALVAYSRVAHEGGFDLSSRPNLRGWIARTEQALGIN